MVASAIRRGASASSQWQPISVIRLVASSGFSVGEVRSGESLLWGSMVFSAAEYRQGNPPTSVSLSCFQLKYIYLGSRISSSTFFCVRDSDRDTQDTKEGSRGESGKKRTPGGTDD